MGGLRIGQYAKAVFREKRAVYCLGFLLAAVLAVACGGNDSPYDQVEPTIAGSVSPTAAPSTPSPTAEPTAPSATSTAAATALPTATQVEPSVDPDCAKRANNHLNIAKLADQPTLANAVITEIDDASIRIVFEGIEVIVSGVGSSMVIRTNLANDRLAPLNQAIDAVAYEC